MSLRKVRAGSRSSQPVLVNGLFLLKADSNIALDIIDFLLCDCRVAQRKRMAVVYLSLSVGILTI